MTQRCSEPLARQRTTEEVPKNCTPWGGGVGGSKGQGGWRSLILFFEDINYITATLA